MSIIIRYIWIERYAVSREEHTPSEIVRDGNSGMKKQIDLIVYLFEGQPQKIRIARTPETILDLRSDLEVAYCLLSDRRLVLEYEPYASGKRRGPDFAITYRINLVFNKDFLHLSAILLWAAGAQLWINKQARSGLSEKVLRLVSALAPCAKQAPID